MEHLELLIALLIDHPVWEIMCLHHNIVHIQVQNNTLHFIIVLHQERMGRQIRRRSIQLIMIAIVILKHKLHPQIQT